MQIYLYNRGMCIFCSLQHVQYSTVNYIFKIYDTNNIVSQIW